MPNKSDEACMIRLWYTMRGWKMDKNGHMFKMAGEYGSKVKHRRRITKTSVINEVYLHGRWVQGGRQAIHSFAKMIQHDNNETNENTP